MESGTLPVAMCHREPASGQSLGKTSYLSLDNETWVPGILLEGSRPKEAKPSIIPEMLLPKEGTFEH